MLIIARDKFLDANQNSALFEIVRNGGGGT